MKISLKYNRRTYEVDLSKSIDISIPLIPGAKGPRCFYAPRFSAKPYKSGNFIGAVKEGAPVNFYNVRLNPHGNGTHTESVGHITTEQESINDVLKEFHCVAQVMSVCPKLNRKGDRIITKSNLKTEWLKKTPKALIIRTYPNPEEKKTMDYSGTNPPYFKSDAIKEIVNRGVKHLLIDLPSVDREEDDGKLQGHKIFWDIKSQNRKDCTITEMIYVPDEIEDGLYFMNLQIPSFQLDAAPSKPVLYRLKTKK